MERMRLLMTSWKESEIEELVVNEYKYVLLLPRNTRALPR